jgi:catechol 2,3-dioxygenase-like lactoylglutathione lyase family enzyme
MVQAIRMGHLTLQSKDIERQIEYFTEVVGLVVVDRSRDRAFLATPIGQLAVELQSAEHAGCNQISLEVSPHLEAADITKDLSELGIAWRRSSQPFPGVTDVVTFRDNKGTDVQLFMRGEFVSPSRDTLGVGPIKLGHVAFSVISPQQTANFFTQTLGFRVSDWIQDIFVFQRCNPDHHTLNFVAGERAEIAHFAFELKDFAHLQAACDMLGRHRISIARGPLRHGPGHNVAVYHQTPDGLTLEFFVEMDRMSNEELGYFDPKPWHRDFPQRPKTWDRKDNGTVIWGIRPPR